MTQHNIVVRVARAGFEVDRPELSIGAGDLVLWNCANRRALPYAVVGDKPFFRSDRLLNEGGYSHAFGFAGEYRWRDAHGSEAGGTVRVRQPDCRHEEDCGSWLQSLSKGALVMIADGRVEPREVGIVLGQTVFFAVTRGPGISITDERLLGRDHQDHGRERGAA